MYHNRTNMFFHGIMFHHFHDGKFHKKSQGSISKDDFYKIIKFIDAISFKRRKISRKITRKKLGG